MHELASLGAAGAIAGLIYALGILVERATGLDAGAWSSLARITGGLMAAGTVLTLFAATGFYRPWPMALAGLAAIAGALLVGRPAETASRLRAPSVVGGLTLLLVLAATLPIAWLAMSPTVLWDAAVYHLTLPRLYLEHGGFQPLEPTSPYAVWPHFFQLLYGPALLLGGAPAAKLLHFGCGLAVCGALWLAGRQEERPLAGLVAILLFLSNGVVIFELSVAYVDLAHALFLVAAFLFLEESRRRGFGVEPLLHAGLAAAGALSVKATGVLFLIPLAVPLLAAWRSSSLPRHQLVRRLYFLIALPLAVAGAFWGLRAWLLTGNPFYPFAWSIFGGPDWGVDLQRQFGDWQGSIGMGRGLADYLLLPWRIFTSGGPGYERFDGELSPALLALLPFALWQARRPGLGRRALLVWVLYLGLWAIGSQQMRFLVPSLPFLCLAIGLGIAELASALRPRGQWVVAALLVVAWAAHFTASHASTFGRGLQYWRIYRDARFEPGAAEPAWRAALAALQADAKVLMLNTNEGYFSPRPFVADSFFEASQIADWLKDREPLAIAAALKSRGISHVLLLRQRRPVTYPPQLLSLLEDPWRARPVWRSDDQSWLLFALVPPG